jgi:histidinol-phosphate/aromatic aminotransferase/cobyric acid decarboxylase-like protein
MTNPDYELSKAIARVLHDMRPPRTAAGPTEDKIIKAIRRAVRDLGLPRTVVGPVERFPCHFSIFMENRHGVGGIHVPADADFSLTIQAFSERYIRPMLLEPGDDVFLPPERRAPWP